MGAVTNFLATSTNGLQFHRAGVLEVYRLLQCSGCNRGGLLHYFQGRDNSEHILSFYPVASEQAALPDGVPAGVVAEFREAESCFAHGEHRAASAMVRSALEKALKANGYLKRSLAANIDDAGLDGVITAARRQKAQDDVRVLGNEVVHDEWRVVTSEEVMLALHFTQRILEDLYDDRPTVEGVLRAKGRTPE
jgi:Domain of unknown function (DUF4145)